MAIAPDNLLSRLKIIFQEEPNAAVNQLAKLIEEIFALVEKHMPQIDTAAAWESYHRWSNNYQHLAKKAD